jgi:hypothetical protein
MKLIKIKIPMGLVATFAKWLDASFFIQLMGGPVCKKTKPRIAIGDIK